MLRAYKYRIYPVGQQKELIEKTFNYCRLVYNLALETKITRMGSPDEPVELLPKGRTKKQESILCKQIY
jgi:transposase